MAEALIILSFCCVSSSGASTLASSVGYFTGSIPNTAPHFLKHMDASDIRKRMRDATVKYIQGADVSDVTDPGVISYCQEVDYDTIFKKMTEYESEKVFSLFDFESLEKEEVLNNYLKTSDIDYDADTNLLDIGSYLCGVPAS